MAARVRVAEAGVVVPEVDVDDSVLEVGSRVQQRALGVAAPHPRRAVAPSPRCREVRDEAEVGRERGEVRVERLQMEDAVDGARHLLDEPHLGERVLPGGPVPERRFQRGEARQVVARRHHQVDVGSEPSRRVRRSV